MKQASRSFAAGSLAAHHPGITPSRDLSQVASTFVDLQQARHDADYDLSLKLNRSEVLLRVREVERAFASWKSVRGTDEAKVFLTSLLVDKQWRRRQ